MKWKINEERKEDEMMRKGRMGTRRSEIID
jgi:hypothetical protein